MSISFSFFSCNDFCKVILRGGGRSGGSGCGESEGTKKYLG